MSETYLGADLVYRSFVSLDPRSLEATGWCSPAVSDDVTRVDQHGCGTGFVHMDASLGGGRVSCELRGDKLLRGAGHYVDLRSERATVGRARD